MPKATVEMNWRERRAKVTRQEVAAMDVDTIENEIRETVGHVSDRERRLVYAKVTTGATWSQAMQSVGYTPDREALNRQAHALTRKKHVSYLMLLLQEQQDRQAETTGGWVRAQLKQEMLNARADGDHSSVIAALRELSKLGGHYPDGTVNVDVTAVVYQQVWAEVINNVRASLEPPQHRIGFEPQKLNGDGSSH